ncbi:Ig-like domain-containing protein [Algibacter agarivorans]
MKNPLLILLISIFFIGNSCYSQNIQIDVNLNMKHSVEGVSDFGRERHMTIHSSPTENDWNGEEDKLDYLINDLGVYFGRETGSATWKMQGVEEDPNNPGWPYEAQMITHGNGLKNWSDSPDFASRRQYRSKSNNMIMGINDTSPMYSGLSWFEGFGRGKGGWFIKDVDAGAEWTALYLDHYFAKSSGDIGDPLPKYWEVYNEPDMNFMNPQFGMIISSLEKNWEYHKLVAQNVRAKLGVKAPKIGGMTWGQLDFFKPDGIPTRSQLTYWTQWLEPDNPMIPLYENMLSGVNGWPKAWDKRQDAWWQWDYLWQGFIDHAGADMDFYGVHLYDWPNANTNQATIRSGGHTEAMLDQLEWYDYLKFGDKKDIVISEFGAVNTDYINSLPDRRRDWEFLKPFNQMFMEILERPSHVVMSMPFTPAKAVWGAFVKGGNGTGDVQRYDGSTLFEPVGTWQGENYVIGEPSGGWQWSPIIYYFELWKDVDGTRIDTKSNTLDVQVDAYVKDKHVYLILNNTNDDIKTINLNTFNSTTANTVNSVQMRHLFFNPNLGTQGEPDLSVVDLDTAPAQVTLKPNSTIVLDYTYANTVEIDIESKETKYMSDALTTATNSRGTQLCRLTGQNKFTTTVKNIIKPAKGEAMVRIGGFFYNPTDAGDGKSIKVNSLKINGNEVVTQSPMLLNPRGHVASVYGGGWFGVLEIEIPIEFLNNGNNTVYFERQQNADFTTVMLQVWDMDQDPGRTDDTTTPLTSISLGSDESLMNGNNLGIVPVFTPTDASNKGLIWTSSDSNVATVDENGAVTAVADSGVTLITATSTENGSIFATKTITAIPFETSTVTSIEILEGDQITVDHFVNTPLTSQLNPTPENTPEIEWTSSNEANVSVLATGKLIGKIIGGSAVITAKVKGTSISDAITVNVRIAGEESVFTRELPDFLRPFTTGIVSVPVSIMGNRTVTMELIKDGNILGSGSQNVNALGDETVEVTYNLASTPAPGTGYSIKLTLKDGSTVLDTEIKTIEILDHVRVSSVTIQDGLPVVQVGETITRTAIALPADAFNTDISWSSSNTAVATVDISTGEITGQSVGQTTIRATSVDMNTIFDEVTINVQSDPVSVDIVSITIPTSINVFPGLNKTLPITLNPEYTTDTDINWTSNNGIVTVDQNGVITAGLVDGTAIITATSAANASVFATCTVNVSKTIYIEAETLVNTGGASDGVVINPNVGFNNNTSGDWADYTVSIPASGMYALQFNIGTPNSTGLGVNVYVDGVLLNTTTLSGTAAWENYTTQSGSGEINISEGTHTIRFESTGATEWQWNADWFSLTYTGTLSVGEKKLSNISVFPNPTYGEVVINGLTNSSTVAIYNIQGSMIEHVKVTGSRVNINLKNYQSGLYLIKVTDETSSDLFKIIKK